MIEVVIVGGGTAGWLAACLIAARANPASAAPLSVTLIESPDVRTIGVGEGTWPTMRRTLARIGISEAEFLIECDASFKQGSRFNLISASAASAPARRPIIQLISPNVSAFMRACDWQEYRMGNVADGSKAEVAR